MADPMTGSDITRDAPPDRAAITRAAHRALDFLDRGDPESAKATLRGVLSLIPLESDELNEVFAALRSGEEPRPAQAEYGGALYREFTHGGLYLSPSNRDRLVAIVDAALAKTPGEPRADNRDAGSGLASTTGPQGSGLTAAPDASDGLEPRDASSASSEPQP